MEDESCRILTISSTIKGATAFIESVKALTSLSPSSPLEKSAIPLSVPWTITNRYYVADVHFSAWTVDKLFPALFDVQPPALVFVWSEGQPFVEDVKEIARLMKIREYEPEVALAVRIPGTQKEETIDCEEAEDIDSKLMSYGFEYIDATRQTTTVEDDIPALPRVLDALSTIMWPSMRSNKLQSGPKSPLDFDRSFDELEDEDLEKENMLRELLNETKDHGLSASTSDEIDDDQEFMAQMKAMMDAEKKSRWNRPWVSTSGWSSPSATVSEMTMSPIEMVDGENSMKRSEKGPAKEKVSLGFEDDFSVFVSAPPEQDEKRAGLDSAGYLGADDEFRYRTLGSVSDFGGSDEEEETSKKTARQIFGDVEEVFGVLREYKTEIAGVESEEERRMTAARVALGLVYGL